MTTITATSWAAITATVGAAIMLASGCAGKAPPRPEPEPIEQAPTPPPVAPERPPAAAAEPTPVPTPSPTSTPSPAATDPVHPDSPPPGAREVFPSVRVDAAAKVVEFDGVVPIDAHDPDAPLVFLELVACTPDTREHESLVMTRADAAHVHAALLLVGLEPGAPGSWTWDGTTIHAIPPRGPGLDVLLVTRDAAGAEVVATPQSWIVSARDGRRFDAGGAGAWIFAGSIVRTRQGREVYEAQGAGTLIGLTTFGSETIAWREVISPEAAIEEPEWIADKAIVPRMGTPVTVRIRAR